MRRHASRWWIAGLLTGLILAGRPVSSPLTLTATTLDTGQRGPAMADRWPKVQISDPVTRDATKRALDGAARWLSAARCEGIFSEFEDATGLSLRDRLRQLESNPADYLGLIFVQDGSRHPTCERHGVLAFTAVGSRLVYVCGRDFARAWSKDQREVQSTLIHEMLHSLGLGENPPAPREITARVQRMCWQ